MRIAIVGTGISGLSAAWLLNRRHNITVFEADARLGGHANTVDLDLAGQNVSVDTGFIVYNEYTYPLLTKLFDVLLDTLFILPFEDELLNLLSLLRLNTSLILLEFLEPFSWFHTYIYQQKLWNIIYIFRIHLFNFACTNSF